MSAVTAKELNDGRSMPAIGFGTWQLRGDDGVTAMGAALECGYRMIDTAARYENEGAVGRAVAESGLPRESLFITTKLPGDDQGYDATMRACEGSLQRLGLQYVDLYLIHWPLPRIDRYVDTWRAFVALREQGLARSIGVSNFTGAHLDRLVRETDVVPAVNQIEMHPLLPQAQQRAYDRDHGIVTQGWSPLGRKSDLLDSPVLAEIADTHGVSVGQVVLRWHVEMGAVPLPKSAHSGRIAQNYDVFGFTLSANELEAIGTLDRGQRLGGDPDTHEEF
ncbi:MAG: aldo/keto reductase [Actinomycetia bacterium]|nr:aldo/keto reductase [Actinomycetes bacterium]